MLKSPRFWLLNLFLTVAVTFPAAADIPPRPHPGHACDQEASPCGNAGSQASEPGTCVSLNLQYTLPGSSHKIITQEALRCMTWEALNNLIW